VRRGVGSMGNWGSAEGDARRGEGGDAPRYAVLRSVQVSCDDEDGDIEISVSDVVRHDMYTLTEDGSEDGYDYDLHSRTHIPRRLFEELRREIAERGRAVLPTCQCGKCMDNVFIIFEATLQTEDVVDLTSPDPAFLPAPTLM